MRETLLQKAKKVKQKINKPLIVNSEEIELAFAWLKDEIGLRQMSAVLGISYSGGSCLYRISIILKEAYKKGILKIKKNK